MTTKEKDPPVVILYHNLCRDGFASAWVAWKKFGDRAQYIGVDHQTPPPPLFGKVIYSLDFAYPDAELTMLEKNNTMVVVIDHHRSTASWVSRRPHNIADDRHSAAVLTWKYFFPRAPIPRLVRHVEDEDLWLKKMNGTRELTLMLDTLPQNFEAWDRMIRDCQHADKRKKYILQGAAIDSYRKVVIADIVSTARLVRFAGRDVFVAHAPHVFRSEVGAILANKGKSGLGIVWSEGKNKRYISLRSRGAVDVSKLAVPYGGGGHVHASGFILGLDDPLPWKEIKKNKK
jgi:oligoribonuclease NrnB/cAMP/cGMP phosphodiesterase (DHH superfamily)